MVVVTSSDPTSSNNNINNDATVLTTSSKAGDVILTQPFALTTNVFLDAFVSIHWPRYRNLTVTDIDRVIVLPVTLQVDARDQALVTQEDVLMDNYDAHKSTTSESDYVLYAKVLRDKVFNPGFEWKYQVTRSPLTGEISMSDANVVSQSNPIINMNDLAEELTNSPHTTTRFMHYKQAHSFFKYSFPVGNSFVASSSAFADKSVVEDGSNALVQLNAVYLDSCGQPVPYMISTPSSQAAFGETDIKFIVANMPSGLNPMPSFSDPDTQTETLLSQIICPPDPNFLSHGPLVAELDSGGDYIIRNVYGRPNYTASNFIYFDHIDPSSMSSQAPLTLMLYYLVKPPQTLAHKGDALYICYTSAETIPNRDGRSMAKHPDLQKMSKVFTLKDNKKKPVPYHVHSLFEVSQQGSQQLPAPRLHMPLAFYSVRQHDDTGAAASSTASGGNNKDVYPFQYESLNYLKYQEPHRRNIGSRLIQLVSEYLFDSSTETELGYFPFFIEESCSIIKKIVYQLSNSLQSNSDLRTQILKQILIKHGRKYFNEYEQMTGTSDGNVRDVVNRIDDFFLFFTVSLRTHVSFRSKNITEAITLEEVPVVLHIVDSY